MEYTLENKIWDNNSLTVDEGLTSREWIKFIINDSWMKEVKK